jgi:GWxTD domain
LDYDFKTEFYRRIVFANEKYGSKMLAGRKTDRGRLYVIFGAPDSVERTSEGATGETEARAVETWHYHYIKGIGENVEIHFDYNGRYDDYALRDADRYLVLQADLGPEQFPVTLENVGRLTVMNGPAKIRFKDLEAILVSQVPRDQLKIMHGIEFSAATRATTLAKISVEIPCENCTRDGQIPPSSAYPLFIRVSQRSGRVVATSEPTAENAMREVGQSKFVLDARVDIPLAPGDYELAIAAKNPSTGEAGVVRTSMQVPRSCKPCLRNVL